MMSSEQPLTQVKSAKYITTAPYLAECPNTDLPEVAFIGRSNVGKSSLINFLCNNKNLALVSKLPGKTRGINFFLIDNYWHLVDLPGYGYAKTNKENRWSWLENSSEYFVSRQNLKVICVLIDSNISPQSIDIEFINWLHQHNLNFVIVFTKADKSSQKVVSQNTKLFLNEVSQISDISPDSFIVTTEKKASKDKLFEYMNEVVNN
jgi:GTP-binding protein